MSQLRYLRGKIKSLKSTTKITKAMQLVSSSKYRALARKIDHANKYFREISVIEKITKCEDLDNLSQKTKNLLYGYKDSNNCLLVIFSPSRGLCGGVNTQLQKFVTKSINAVEANKNLTIITIGGKVYDYLKRKHQDLKAVNYSTDYSEKLNNLLENEMFAEVKIIYTHCNSIISYTPTILHKFPLYKADFSVPQSGDILMEPEKSFVIKQYMNLLFNSTLEICALHAETSEHAGRMIAMDNATKNGNNIMQDMITLANKVRQANVTRELIDIVSGAQNC